ncbi:hypothetical protein [Capnocytophaga catalasegens]|uniref:Lipocalin-like domain-containing protein n=1 Tax=Capnocytophaga catalasegens TaxID=1004260 RepID=A0AAV5AXY7_9FLAO|nr:hypothetical protein [Capnocytophaga catalasegens]GIZ16200.1 hypothetical protein RCZ03_22000 [Capnocytophaga catalasegens]GJM51619.1 hypothetical protein RCZ15_25920 [Capnocytophaga catalasegens]GJM54269.1 hypothetical protein RCZ16_25850 [Capnocytophaga catalasegens]
MKKIAIVILILISQCVFAQKDEQKKFDNLYEENRPCDKIINEEYSQLLIGKWKLSHSLEGNEVIKELKSEKIHFKKNRKFKEVREGEVFKGTWKVCSCIENNLVLTSNHPMILKKELEELEKMIKTSHKKGKPKGKSKSFMTIHKITKDTLTILFYMDLEKEFPRYIFYIREK